MAQSLNRYLSDIVDRPLEWLLIPKINLLFQEKLDNPWGNEFL